MTESMLSKQQLGVLMSPIHSSRVATRQQGGTSGKTLSYVEAFDIKATLIRIFGFGGFSAEVIDAKIIDIRDNGRQGQYQSGEKKGQDKTPYVMAQSTVRLTIYGIGPDGQDVVYTETAVGTNDGWTIGDVADNAIKSASSDALKRCATYLGSQFGLSLYQNGSKAEIVKVLFPEPQAGMLNELREEQAKAISEQAHQQVEQALSAKRNGRTTQTATEPVSVPPAAPRERE